MLRIIGSICVWMKLTYNGPSQCWDWWPSTSSQYVTSQPGQLALHPSGVTNPIKCQLCWGRVTAGMSATLCDPIRHVVVWQHSCKQLYPSTLLLTSQYIPSPLTAMLHSITCRDSNSLALSRSCFSDVSSWSVNCRTFSLSTRIVSLHLLSSCSDLLTFTDKQGVTTCNLFIVYCKSHIYCVLLFSDLYCVSLQCFDTVAWAAGRASGL